MNNKKTTFPKNKTSNTTRKIVNNNDFKTYAFIININEANEKVRQSLSRFKSVKDSENLVYITGRAFNYLELLVWLHNNYGLSLNYLCSLRPKVYPNKVINVPIDLTTHARVKDSKNLYEFKCKVEAERNLFNTIDKQLPLFNPTTTKFIRKSSDAEDQDLFFRSNHMNFTTYKADAFGNLTVSIISDSEVINNENSEQAKVRRQFKDAKFEGLLANTSFIVPVNSEQNDLIFVTDKGAALKRLKSSRVRNMPYKRDMIHFSKITPSTFDFITIEDYYNSIGMLNNSNLSLKASLINQD